MASIDLVPLSQVKDWLKISQNNTDSDKTIQFLITAFSQYVLNKTGHDSFTKIIQYTEYYDGNGNQRMFLNNSPITELISVLIGSYSAAFSTGTNSSGLFVEQSQKSIAFRSSGGILYPAYSIYPYRFIPGVGNIQVIYKAGYSAVPYDLSEAVMETVAQNYMRRDWIDLASKSLSIAGGGAGTTSYRSWGMTPQTASIIDIYSRYARP